MSIRPPSDIVLDVARAADPARAQDAARRLGEAPPADAFDAAMRAAAPPPSPRDTLTALSTPSARTVAPASAGTPKAYRDLEAFFLRTAFDTMMPAPSRAAGAGAGIWKSMLAEALAAETERAGGIGLFRAGSAKGAA